MATLNNTVRLDPTRAEKPDLVLLGDRCSRLWNAANYVCRQRFIAGEGVPRKFDLSTLMLGTDEYRQLPSDIAQEVIAKLAEAWSSYFKLRAKWKEHPQENQKPGLPRYRKDRRTGARPFDLIPLKCARAYSIDPKHVEIVLPRDRRPKGGGRLSISYRGRDRHQGKMGRAEISHDAVRRRWYMKWSVAIERPLRDGGLSAAVDLGVRISASLSIEGVRQALHFCGRDLLHDWDWTGRKIATEQSHLAQTRGRGEDKHPPHSRAISIMYARRKARLRHAMTCMAKAIAERCLASGITHMYIGWPKNILRDRSYGSRWNDRIHGFWSFALTIGLLKNALNAVGIHAHRVGERGSSSTCSDPDCRSRNVVRQPREQLRCRDCGSAVHSDQAGSRNILLQNKPSVRWDGPEAGPRTKTHRWTRHLWIPRSANPSDQAALPA